LRRAGPSVQAAIRETGQAAYQAAMIIAVKEAA